MITFFKKTINYDSNPSNDSDNFNELIDKIYDNDIDAAKNIIENQANILNLQDENGMTALMWAIKRENKELVELILSKNPNVNIGDNFGWIAFDYANSSYNEEIKKLFNEDSEIYKANQAFENLIDKIHNNDINAVKNIIENQANILNLQDENGRTALMIAIQTKNKELVELILSKNPDVDLRDNFGETALMIAIQTRNKELVELILSKNPDVNIMDNDGRTALMIAIQTRNKELVELILSKGANVNIMDNNGWTALMLAIRYQNKEIVELILSKNPDVNIKDNGGETAFNYANLYNINLKELIDKVNSSKGN